LVIAKFLPGLGAAIPPLAGALGFSVGHFLMFDSFGSLIYGTIYIAAGYLFHNQLHRAFAVLKQLGFSAFLLALALGIAYVALKYSRQRLFFIAWRRPKTTETPHAEMRITEGKI
jgi:membrane protein DedA with SNARE-associated domain